MNIVHPSKPALVYIWMMLVLLHFMILGSAYLNLGWGNVLISLALAVAQAVLVALYYMGVKSSAKPVWLLAGAGFFWLAIQWTLTFADYFSRRYH